MVISTFEDRLYNGSVQIQTELLRLFTARIEAAQRGSFLVELKPLIQQRFLTLQHLCRNAYNMVINKFGDRLYNGLVQTQTEHLRLVAAKIEAAQGETFLRELKLRWDHHNKSMQMIRDILMVC